MLETVGSKCKCQKLNYFSKKLPRSERWVPRNDLICFYIPVYFCFAIMCIGTKFQYTWSPVIWWVVSGDNIYTRRRAPSVKANMRCEKDALPCRLRNVLYMQTLYNPQNSNINIESHCVQYSNALRLMFGVRRSCSASNMFTGVRLQFCSQWHFTMSLFAALIRARVSGMGERTNSFVNILSMESRISPGSIIDVHWRKILHPHNIKAII